MSPPRETNFIIQGKSIAGQLWGDDGLPVIALHGWLDNCHSFLRLAPQLKGVQLLALDLAGHGMSEHRSADANYHIWDDIREVVMVANEMGWQRFSLLGHSRGAIISMLMGAVLPERIDRLLLVEGLLPLTQTADQAPAQLKRFLERTFQDGGVAKGRKSLESMVKGRLQAGYGIDEAAARSLVERNVECIDGYYYWRTDPRLVYPSPVMLTPGVAESFLSAVEVPSLLICGDSAMGASKARWEQHLQDKPNFSVKMISGGHHLHMEDGVTAVAEAINQFLP